MQEQTTNVGVTHVWPYSKLVNPEAQRFSDEREADVWDELRDLTFDGDVRGKICVALHETINHNAAQHTFNRELLKGDVVNNRVAFYRPRKLEFNIHRPATPEVTVPHLRSVDEEFRLGPDGFEEVPDTSTPIVLPATEAHDEKQTRTIPFHLGSKLDAEFAVKQYRNHEICALVLWYPDDSRQLKYLSLVRARCPELPIYMFHCDYRSDKYGVEREGASNREDYIFSTLPDHEEEDVLEHLLAKDALTMMPGPSYTGKTHLAISMGLSLVTGEAWLGTFKVPEKLPVIYFVPELSAGRFKKFMTRIAPSEVWKQYEDRFIVRPLDCDLLLLDSEEMIGIAPGIRIP